MSCIRALAGGLLALLLALPAGAAPPRVEARLDTAVATLGDPVVLTLHLRYDREWRPLLPDVEEALKGFAARALESSTPAAGGGGMLEVEQRYELRPFRLGKEELAPLEVVFAGAGGDTLRRRSQPLALEVRSVRQQGEQELRDIKPPVEVPGGWPLWAAVLMGVGLLVLLAALGWWLWRRRSTAGEVAPQPAPVDYAAEFARIAGLRLLEKGDYKTYYSLLADNLRRYLEARLGIEAMERTTGEIVVALRQAGLEGGQIRPVETFLQAADLVKFARFHPDMESARRVPEAGMAIVRSLDRFAALRRARQEEEARAADQTAA